MTAEIRQLLHAQPFVPFTIRVADGREYKVPTPDHAHVGPAGGRIVVFTDEGLSLILPGLLVSGVALESSDRFGEDPAG